MVSVGEATVGWWGSGVVVHAVLCVRAGGRVVPLGLVWDLLCLTCPSGPRGGDGGHPVEFGKDTQLGEPQGQSCHPEGPGQAGGMGPRGT